MIILTITSCIFDFFIIMNFFNHSLKNKKGIHSLCFYGAFFLAEIVMNITPFFVDSLSPTLFQLLNVIISTLTIFLLSFLYESNIIVRLLLSIIYIFLANVADDFFSIVISSFFPNIMDNMNTNTIMLGSLCVEIILFVLTLIFNFLWSLREPHIPIRYNILILIIPVASFIISFLIMTDSLAEAYETTRINAIRLILLFINIVNTYVLEESFQNRFLKSKNQLLETEIRYQKEKYTQISSSYRHIKKYVHDTKKHLFTLNRYLEAGATEELKMYLDKSISDIDATYAKFNTGNLVFDSYLAYFETLFRENNIPFYSNVNLDINRITIDDYDLSIIIGNLLDNGYNAAIKSPLDDYSFLIEIYMNDKNQMIIHTKNPYDKSFQYQQSLEHGYGLSNIQSTVTNYNGIIDITRSDSFEVYIVLPLEKI